VASASAKRYIQQLDERAMVFVAPQAAAVPIRDLLAAPKASGDDAIRLLYVGTSAPRKNFGWMVEQLSQWLAQAGVRAELAVVGPVEPLPDGSYSSLLRIQYTGHIEPDRVHEHYDVSDALVFPTREDEWGLVVNEALSRGCVVVGSIRSEAVIELVASREVGWSFDPEDGASFSAAMNQLLESLRDPIGHAAITMRATEVARSASVEGVADAFVAAIAAGPSSKR
jgi:glycosyltransferase involved in cell wall biosynthesis